MARTREERTPRGGRIWGAIPPVRVCWTGMEGRTWERHQMGERVKSSGLPGNLRKKTPVSVSPMAAKVACEDEPSAECVRPEDKSIVCIVLF